MAPAAEVAALRSKVQAMEDQLAATSADKLTSLATAYVDRQIADGRCAAKAKDALLGTYVRAASGREKQPLPDSASVAKAGEVAVDPFLLPKGTLTLGRRVTAGGNPVGKEPMPTTDFSADSPEAVEHEIAERAKALREKDKTLSVGDSHKAVLAADPDLNAQYRALMQ